VSVLLKKVDKNQKRIERHNRIRNKITGTPERPRLNIFKSSKHIYAQVIDDATGTTLVSASTQDKELREKVAELTKQEAAKFLFWQRQLKHMHRFASYSRLQLHLEESWH
jgi:large subunit ribosomal protein L18